MHRIALILLALPLMAQANTLLAPGDLDRNGVDDLIRIARDGTVWVTNVDGGQRYSFQTFDQPRPSWWSDDREPFDRYVGGGQVVPDLNTNGSPEILLVGLDPYRAADFYGRSEAYDCEVWDPMTQALLWRATNCGWGGVVGDFNQDGAPEVAIAHHWRINTHDLATGVRLATIRQRFRSRDMVASDRYGVGILADRCCGLSDQLQFRNPLTDELTQRIWLGANDDHRLQQAVAIEDLNGNRSHEWAIMKTIGFRDDMRTEVNFRDSRTRAYLGTVHFTGWATPMRLMVVNGDDLALVSSFSSGAQPLEVRDASGTKVRRVWFPQSLRIETITQTPDINGNGSEEIAVGGEQWGRFRVHIRDSRSGAWVRRMSIGD